MSKLVVISAPSGAGKTSIANCLINRIEQLSFSISATSRSPRVDEKDSVNYYFKSIDEFKNDINKNFFIFPKFLIMKNRSGSEFFYC